MSPTNQPAGPGPDSLYRAVEPYLSPPRLGPFLAASRGNHKLAIQLYQWNVHLSGATYEALHLIEVTLRNTIDQQLRVWNATQVDQPSGNSHNPDWLIDPAPLLSRLLQADLAKATQRAQLATRTHGRVPAHHDILAQLSFGAWRFLLPNANPGRQYLWNHALTRAFPHLARPVNDFVADIDSLYRLRNRVAHLESVLDIRFANRHFRAMRRVLGEVDPRVEEWFTSQQRITTVLKNRPTT